MMKVEIPFGEHKPLKNDDREPYEFELKPTNGKMIRAYHECRFCDCLYRAGSRAMCVAAPVEDEHESMKKYFEARDRLEESGHFGDDDE